MTESPQTVEHRVLDDSKTQDHDPAMGTEPRPSADARTDRTPVAKRSRHWSDSEHLDDEQPNPNKIRKAKRARIQEQIEQDVAIQSQVKWKNIEDFPNYQVSNTGQIRNRSTLRVLKQRLNSGYARVQLQQDGKQANRFVHRLVAAAFLDPAPSAKHSVNHISGNKRDNRVSNLAWATQSEQVQHAYETKLHRPYMRGVFQYTMEGKEVARHESIRAAAISVGASAANISKCLSGIRNYAGGYAWRYETEKSRTLPDEKDEKWEKTKHSSHYWISNHGRVKVRTENIMMLQLDANGYQWVTFVIDGKTRKFSIHRLVAECFVSNPDGHTVVNHKDHDRSNNHWSNLEWTTQQGNVRHGLGKAVLQLDRDGKEIARFGSIAEAAESLKISRQAIDKRVQGRATSAFGGFHFRYI